MEPLFFAIYSMAAMSLNDRECQEYLNEPQKTVLARYIECTKVSLSRAKFMSTTSLLVLQALVLHILSVRDFYEPRAIWSLTGVALRIAQSMGLERDGVSLGLPPFETEMRRRIWWLLKTHDYQTAELCGLSKFRNIDSGTESTKWPSNVNDDQLHPGMTETPRASETLTDAAFVGLRYELASFATRRVNKYRQNGEMCSGWERHLASGEDREESDAALKELEGHFETRYLRYCDPSQPLHLMTMLLARAAINTIRFLTHHPRRWASISQTPSVERQWVWDVCLQLLEQHNMLQSNPQLKRFAWHAAFVMQWHAFIHVLDTLRVEPHIQDADRAWKLIGDTYKKNHAMTRDKRKPIHIAVASLCLKAYDARKAMMISPNANSCPSQPPEFILNLRKQYDIAKMETLMRPARREQWESFALLGAELTIAIPDPSAIYSGEATELANNPQNGDLSEADTVQCDGRAAGSDSFWLLDELHDCHRSSGNPTASRNGDFILPQNGETENNTYATISWEQWDTWLLESNDIV